MRYVARRAARFESPPAPLCYSEDSFFSAATLCRWLVRYRARAYSGVERCHGDVGRYVYARDYRRYAYIRLLVNFEFIRLIISAPIALVRLTRQSD